MIGFPSFNPSLSDQSLVKFSCWDVIVSVRFPKKSETEKEKEERRKQLVLEKLARKVKAARKKLKALADAEYELELQQAKMAKTATSGGFTKSGRRIKVRERKR